MDSVLKDFGAVKLKFSIGLEGASPQGVQHPHTSPQSSDGACPTTPPPQSLATFFRSLDKEEEGYNFGLKSGKWQPTHPPHYNGIVDVLWKAASHTFALTVTKDYGSPGRAVCDGGQRHEGSRVHSLNSLPERVVTRTESFAPPQRIYGPMHFWFVFPQQEWDIADRFFFR